RAVPVSSTRFPALAYPVVRAGAGGTAVVLTDRTVNDSTCAFDISENYVDAWRAASQMDPVVTNDTNLLLTFTGIPPGVTLNLTGGGAATISNTSLTQNIPVGNLSTTSVTSGANTVVLTFTGLSAPPSLSLIDTIHFRGTIVVNSGSSLAPGSIGVQVSMTPNSPGALCPGEVPIPCTPATVPRFALTQAPSSPLPLV